MAALIHRLGAFLLLSGSLALWGQSKLVLVIGIVSSVVVYAVLFRFRLRDLHREGWAGTLHYDRVPAVILPDWLGMIIAALLFALPVWASDTGTLHPSAWLVWPMGVLFLSMPVIAAKRESFALRIGPASFDLRGMWGEQSLTYPQIARIAPWRRDLPAWLRKLAPLGLAMGQPGVTGAIMLARPSTGLALHLRDGAQVVIPCDGFESGRRKILQTARERGIPAPSK